MNVISQNSDEITSFVIQLSEIIANRSTWSLNIKKKHEKQ